MGLLHKELFNLCSMGSDDQAGVIRRAFLTFSVNNLLITLEINGIGGKK